MKLRRRMASIAAAMVAATGIVLIEASPAAASYQCPGGYGCFYDLDPYRYGEGAANRWIAPSCGTHNLPAGWRDRISYAANWGGGVAWLYNWNGSAYESVAAVPVNTGSLSLVGRYANNRTDRIVIAC